jgi:hypothetical protein
VPLFASGLAAQAPSFPYPTVAPVHPAIVPPPNFTSRYSAWFSAPDGAWGQGEGFPFAIGTSEVGGVLASSYDPNAVHPTIADTVSTTGTPPARWQATQNQPSVVEARGFFWPASAGTPPGANQHSSGWSVLAPASRVLTPAPHPTRPLVLVIGFHESDAGNRILGNYTRPYPYVAGADPYGLKPPGFPLPMEEYIAEAESSKPYDLVMAYAVMPHGARPYPMTLQRGIELVTFVKDLFLTEVGGQTFDLVIAAGGSHGCGNAMLAPTLFPDVFHGGVGFGHPPDLTQPLFSHEFHRWTSSHLGYGGREPFSTYDALGLAFVEKYTGGNPAALSVPARFRAQATAGGPAHYLQRPLFLVSGDEDPTDPAEDWMTLVGVSGPQGASAFQSIAVPNAHPSVRLFLARADKTCHATEGDPVYADPYNPAQTTSNIRLSLYYLIEHALAAAPLPPAVYVPGTTLPPAPPASLVDTHLRPFDGIFGRHIPTHPQTPQPPWPGRELGAVAGWPTLAGQSMAHAGTRLGEGEGLKVSGSSIYVGGAEGVVTRFELAATPLATEPHFERRAQSPDLGYGAWALDIGNLGSGNRVVVATAMGLHVLDPVSLALLSSVPLPDRKEFRPRRLQIVDLDGQGGAEIVFSTVGGRLAVYDAALQRMAWLDEPGILDFVVGPAGMGIPPGVNLANETFKRPIYLALERGHIASVLLQPPASGIQAYLLAVSPGETGVAHDLNFTNGGVLCTYAPASKSADPWAHRFFDPTTLDRLLSLGEPPPGLPPAVLPPLGGIRCAVASTAAGQARYVVLSGEELSVYDAGGGLRGKKDLRSFPPASMPVSLAAGDIDGTSASEILVSTAAGRVVWFRLNELTATGESFPNATNAGWTLRDRTNPSIAASWAMTFAQGKLQVVDQAGIHYEVDPATGVAAERATFGYPGPHRSLHYLGDLHGPVAPTNPPPLNLECWVLGPLAQIGRTAPSPPIPPSTQDTPVVYRSFAIGGYWLASAGGASFTEPGGGTRLWWWNWMPAGAEPYAHDLVLGARINVDLQGSRVLQDLLSASHGSWAGRERLRNNMSIFGQLETGDLQSMSVGSFRNSTDPDVVLSTVGGSVLLLDDADPRPAIVAESPDIGWGGIALAVGDLSGDGKPEILHGSLYSNQRFPNEQQAATLQVLKWGSSALQIANVGNAPLAFASHDPSYPLVGIAGIAIGDVYADISGPEVVVTTIDGYLLVFGVSDLGSAGSPSIRLDLLCSLAQIGALGAHNSIHIGDHATNGTLDAGPDGYAEIYVAGSMGIRRFDTAAQP